MRTYYIAETVHTLRQSQGLTQKALARKAGLSEETIRAVEEGYAPTSIPTAYALAEALGIHISLLCKDDSLL